MNISKLSQSLAGKKILLTGCAGFIGSHLLERLLRLGAEVVGVDNFSNGFKTNLDAVKESVSADVWSRFVFIESCITDRAIIEKALQDVRLVLHQAALGSVPRSFENPLATNRSNIDGFLTVLDAALKTEVDKFVFASSSSIYGTDTTSPKIETNVGLPLSPYATSKRCNELYAGAFAPHTNTSIVGLRYFNVFGPRQNPNGAYAAVIPRWIAKTFRKEQCEIFGDGSVKRDFSFVENIIQANLLALTSDLPKGDVHLFNVACGQTTSLKELHSLIASAANEVSGGEIPILEPKYSETRKGDIPFSLANINKASSMLGYSPVVLIADGVRATVEAEYKRFIK